MYQEAHLAGKIFLTSPPWKILLSMESYGWPNGHDKRLNALNKIMLIKFFNRSFENIQKHELTRHRIRQVLMKRMISLMTIRPCSELKSTTQKNYQPCRKTETSKTNHGGKNWYRANCFVLSNCYYCKSSVRGKHLIFFTLHYIKKNLQVKQP